MPSTSRRVEIDFDSQTAVAPQEQYNDVVMFARATAANEPAPGFNNPHPYSDPTRVAEDFGDGSDAHIASQHLASRGVREWRISAMEETTHSYTVPDSDTTVVSSGQIDDPPMAGNVEATVTVDGADMDVTAVAQSPPNTEREPDSGEALVNYDTGEVVTGTETSGAGSGIVIDYAKVSWADSFRELSSRDEDIAFMPNVRAGKEWLGDIDELATWGMDGYVIVPVAYRNGAALADQQTAMEEAHDMTRYVPSASMMPVAHRSPDDVGASVAGLLATNRPWEDVSIDGAGMPNVAQPTSYADGYIGAPDEANTFEGGDAEGVGATNVLTTAQGTLILSNSLSAAGLGSDYRYVDVFRTEGMVRREVNRNLVSLMLRKSPNFTETGKLQVENVLDQTLNQYEGDNQAYSDLDIFVPDPDDLSEDDRGNRIWTGIGISYRINGTVHQFRVSVTPQV